MELALTVGSLKELAAAIDRTAAAICHWKRDPSWTRAGLPTGPPYDVDAVRRWMRANLSRGPEDVGRKTRPVGTGGPLAQRAADAPENADESSDAGDSGDLTVARVRNLNVRTGKIGLEKSILEGDYMKRADVVRAWGGRVATARAALDAVPKRLEPAFGAVSGSERIRRELEFEIRAVLDAFARGAASPGKMYDALMYLYQATRSKDRRGVRAALGQLESLSGAIHPRERCD